jgi:hypothetical protein
VGQAAQEAALLQGGDQAVDAGLGGQVQRVLHLVEGGGDARLLQPLVDEHEQFVLLAREHGPSSTLNAEQTANVLRCSLGVLG